MPPVRRSSGPVCGLLLLLVALAHAACGGASPSGPPPPPVPTVRFAPQQPAPAAGTVTLQVASASSSALVLEVRATGLSDVATVFFDVVFDPTVLTYASAAAGPFLASQGASVQFNAALDQTGGGGAGRLVVFVSTLPATSGVSGSGSLCTITLRPGAAGTTAVAFERTGGFRPGLVPLPLAFAGGTATVTR